VFRDNRAHYDVRSQPTVSAALIDEDRGEVGQDILPYVAQCFHAMIILTNPDRLDAPVTPAGEVVVVFVYSLCVEVICSLTRISVLLPFSESGWG
jgi:hypothetical protein